MKVLWALLVLLLSQAAYAQTGDGTAGNPFVAMSCDPTQIQKDIRASLAFYNRTDDGYWFSVAGHVTNPFGDAFYCGWNRYWEDRADPANPGSAPRGDARLAAVHKDGGGGGGGTDLSGVMQALGRIEAKADRTQMTVDDVRAAIERVSEQQQAIYHDLTAQVTAVSVIAQHIDAKVQTLQAAGPSWLGKFGSWFVSPTGMAFQAIIVALLAGRYVVPAKMKEFLHSCLTLTARASWLPSPPCQMKPSVGS